MALLICSGQHVTAANNNDITDSIRTIFPTATHVGEKQSDPPLWPVIQVNSTIGYAFNSNDLVNIPGFTGTPVEMLIGLNPDGQFIGVKMLSHNEPIFLHGVGESYMYEFIKQYAGLSVKNVIKVRTGTETSTAGANVYIDGVTKATASVVIINDTILLSALKIASRKLAGFPSGDQAEVVNNIYRKMNWQQLLDAGHVKHLHLSSADIEAGFAGTEVEGLSEVEPSLLQTDYIDFYVAYLNVPTVGNNLLGDGDYARMFEDLLPGEHALLIMSNGDNPFLGPNFVRGSVPDTLALEQGGLPVEIRDIDFYGYYPQNTPAMPAFDSLKLFRIKTDSIFDPGSNWQLNLVVNRSKGRLYGDISARFPVNYKLPDEFFIYPEKHQALIAGDAIWKTLWSNRIIEIIILVLSLILLTGITLFQHRLVKRKKLFRRLRWGFLIYTLFFIGWYAQGQLSIVNVYTLMLNLFDDFKLSIYLIDPVIFILWCFTFVTLLIWGRGIFCGWLCPFGALQEMVSWLAKRLQIKQWRISNKVHKHLLNLKYVIFIGILAISFYSINGAAWASEVEPFKTVFTLAFNQSLPYVAYAILLLGIGLFIHKFFCRYLCPLGAGLATIGLLGRVRWLSRRKACGTRCQYCANKCEIGAIEPSGEINYNECIQCFECIVIYHDNQQCPVLMLDLKGKPIDVS